MARIHRRTIQKDLNDPDNHDGVIAHLEPDILEFEVKWALGSITMNKASGGDGIPVELFQILKDDAVKWCAVSTKRMLKNELFKKKKSKWSIIYEAEKAEKTKSIYSMIPLLLLMVSCHIFQNVCNKQILLL